MPNSYASRPSDPLQPETSTLSMLISIRIPALFNALAMHVLTMCTSAAVGRELAETRAKVCMLGLGSLQKSWPVGGWVYQLWASIMDRLQRKLQHENYHLPSQDGQNKRSYARGEAAGHEERTRETVALRAHGTVLTSDRQVHPESWQHIHQPSTFTHSPWSSMPFSNVTNLVPDIFTSVDTDTRAGFEQSDFFNLLDFPMWTNLG